MRLGQLDVEQTIRAVRNATGATAVVCVLACEESLGRQSLISFLCRAWLSRRELNIGSGTLARPEHGKSRSNVHYRSGK